MTEILEILIMEGHYLSLSLKRSSFINLLSCWLYCIYWILWHNQMVAFAKVIKVDNILLIPWR